MWIKDPKTGDKSVTLTILLLLVIVATAKLMLSGVAISDTFTFEKFTAGDWATIFGPAAGFYWGRRNLKVNHDKNNEN